jgi:indole-3-glycerol phosphate synthase
VSPANILEEIVATKRVEVAAAKQQTPPPELALRARGIAEPTRGFRRALASHEAPAVIAEVKRRSPSKGEIRPGFEPVGCARDYERGGAACLSVLTDESYFGGHLDYLGAIRSAVSLPLLRKDFTIDGYQIDEARVAGADAILLIVSVLSTAQLADLANRARDLDLDALVEVHDEAELDRALECGATLVGVNNRDLTTFEVDLETTVRLAERIPAGADVLLVAESGIHTPEHVQHLARAGAQAFLVGESLMRQPDVGLALAELRGGENVDRLAPAEGRVEGQVKDRVEGRVEGQGRGS